jgi:hypothetical protein
MRLVWAMRFFWVRSLPAALTPAASRAADIHPCMANWDVTSAGSYLFMADRYSCIPGYRPGKSESAEKGTNPLAST